MQLPKFSSGSVGRLEWHHLNEAFAALEQLERDASDAPVDGEKRDRVLTAKVTGSQGQAHSWVEVHRQGTVYIVKPNGQTSSDGVDSYAYPIFGTISGGANPSTAYGIVPQYDSNGKLFYVLGFAAGCCCNP